MAHSIDVGDETATSIGAGDTDNQHLVACFGQNSFDSTHDLGAEQPAMLATATQIVCELPAASFAAAGWAR